MTFLGMVGNIPKANALREIQARQARGPMTADRVYDLVLAAYGDEERAQDEGSQFRLAELMSGQKPAT